MTTDVINGVPRELLEQVTIELEHDTDRYMLGRELRTLLATAKPAADGEQVEVVGYLLEKGNGLLSRMNAGGNDSPLMTVAQHQRIVAAMAAELGDMREKLEVAKTDELNAAVWAETESIRHDMWDAQRERDALRAELAAIKAQEPVAYTSKVKLKAMNDIGVASMWPKRIAEDADVKLYALPPLAGQVKS